MRGLGRVLVSQLSSFLAGRWGASVAVTPVARPRRGWRGGRVLARAAPRSGAGRGGGWRVPGPVGGWTRGGFVVSLPIVARRRAACRVSSRTVTSWPTPRSPRTLLLGQRRRNNTLAWTDQQGVGGTVGTGVLGWQLGHGLPQCNRSCARVLWGAGAGGGCSGQKGVGNGKVPAAMAA
jgi:hypothetical protein